jgi:photosystem II stability/assembly factor-like uncharacterized protein
MIRTIIAASLLVLSTLTFATEIRSLEWLSSEKSLIALTDREVLYFQPSETATIKGPNDQMQDFTLFENGNKLLISTKEGLFQSDLNKINWLPMNDGLESLNTPFVFTNVELQNVLYAATQEAVYKKTPEDTKWVNMDIGPGGAVTDYLHSNMPDSMDTGWIFASTEAGIAFTADCFCFWRDVRNFTKNVHAIAYQPEQPSTYFAVTSDTLYITTDGARSWTELSDIPFDNSSAIVPAGLETLYVGNRDGEIWALNRSSLKWSKYN